MPRRGWGGAITVATMMVLFLSMLVARGATAQGTVCLAPPTPGEIPVGSTQAWVALGDVNRDGAADFVATRSDADPGTPDAVVVRLGDGQGHFGPPPSLPGEVPVGSGPLTANLVDLNGDGHLDIVTTNAVDLSISIRLGSGTGGFGAPTPADVPVGALPGLPAFGDVNGDGKLDILVPLTSSTFAPPFDGTTVAIMLGDGQGHVAPATPATVTVGTGPLMVVTGDLNGDAKVDFLVSNAISGTVSVRLGDGQGHFAPPAAPAPADIPIGDGGFSIVAGDLNGDGKLDFIVSVLGDTSTTGDEAIVVRLGNGNGTFTEPAGSPFAVVDGPGILSLGDLNLDGRPDVLSPIGSPGNEVRIQLGNGSGLFLTPPPAAIPLSDAPQLVAVGDVNGDGAPDLLTSLFSGVIDIRLNCRPNASPLVTVPGPQTVAEDGGLTFSIGNGRQIVASDPDVGPPLRVSLAVSHGTLTLATTTGLTFATGDGTADATMTFTGSVAQVAAALDGLRYAPAPNFSGSDQLVVAVTDLGKGGVGGVKTASGSISIAVTPVNDPPTATADSFVTTAPGPLVVAAPGLLGNDLDADGQPLTAVKLADPANGSVTLNADGGFTYTPRPGFAGSDSFTYQASDGSTQSGPVTVTLAVLQGATPLPSACGPRPPVRMLPVAGGGRLNVHLEGAPHPTLQNNPLRSVTFGALQNARVTMNGQEIASGQTVTLPANVIAVDFTVERVTPGQATTVALTVVDGCGEWKTFVGGGSGAAGF